VVTTRRTAWSPSPECASERSILWNDADIGIDWPLVDAPIVSGKDAEAPGFRGAETFE
jgi:dTDP-4-dehydrorhamnose 3,5-epimerase